jgi:hypothetical protein
MDENQWDADGRSTLAAVGGEGRVGIFACRAHGGRSLDGRRKLVPLFPCA